jgi:TP901 family phage tail tape measure protein
MAKRIQKTDIAEQDVFGFVKKSAEDAIQVIDKLDDTLKEVAKTLKEDLKNTGFGDIKEINEFVKAAKQAEEVKRNALKLDQERAKLDKELQRIDTERQKTRREAAKAAREEQTNAQRAAKQKEQTAKASARAAKAAKDERSEYKKLVVETRKLKQRSQNLGAELLRLEKAGQQNTKRFRELSAQYKKVSKAALEGDKSLKKLDARVGDNFRNVGNYKSALSGLTSTMSKLGLAFGGFQLARGAFDIVKNFDQAQADLQAVSGKTASELKVLTDQAKELGATTQFSATQITEMQIELAKLGFTSEQIQDSTGAVANFSAATGADIPRAAALAGASLRGFGLDASEMERVVSTLGVATTKSALDFQKLETGMSTIAPVANAFGFSIEESTALLGALANSGFDASSAATATRNILLNMADSSGDLAKSLGGPVKNLDDLAAGLKGLEASGVDLATALELTDKRSVAAFQTFLKGTDDLIELRDGITDANAELEAMASKRLDTIGGQFTLLQSAWEGFILSVNEGTGFGNAVKNALGFLAKNLETIMKVVIAAGKAFVTYKAITLTTAAANKVMGLSFVQLGTRIGGVKGAVAGVQGAFKNLGKALKANIFGIVLIALAKLISMYRDAANMTARYGEIQEEINDIHETASEKIGKEKADLALLVGQIKASNGDNERRNELIKELNDKYGVHLKNIEDETEFLKNLDLVQKEIINNLTKEIRLQARRDEFVKVIQELQKAEDELSEIQEANREKISKLNDKEVNDWIARIAGASTQMNAIKNLSIEEKRRFLIEDNLNSKGIAAKQLIAKLQQDQIDLEKKLGTAMDETGKKSKKTGTTTGSAVTSTTSKIKDLNVQLKDQIDLYNELNKTIDDRLKLDQDFASMNIAQELKEINKALKDEGDLLMEQFETGEFRSMEKFVDLVEQRAEIQRRSIEEDRDFRLNQLDLQLADEQAARRKSLDEEKKSLEDKLKKDKETQLGKAANQAERNKIERQFREKSLEIEDWYQGELSDIEQIESAEFENKEQEKINIKEDANNKLLDVEEQTNEALNDMNDKLTDAELANIDKKNKEIAKKEKESADQRIAIAQAISDAAIDASNKRIEQIEKEINAAEQQRELLKEKAAQGNIDAQESLKEQERIIAESNARKEAELRKQERIKLAQAAYEAYERNASDESVSNPLAKTITDITLLRQFISALPVFLEGTEDTGINGQGIDGKGGFHAILHPNERVMTKEQNQLVGDLSNNELAKIAQEYNTGKLIKAGDGAVQIAGPYQTQILVQKLESLEKTIKNKPETNIELEKIVDGAMMIKRSTKKGSTLIYNRYKVK